MLARNRNHLLGLALCATLPAWQAAHAQIFTKITDSNNPVVTDVFNSGGGSWIDVNGDDYLDLFVAHGNDVSQNNSLYLNDRNGGFIKATNGAIVNDGGSSIGSAWGDYDHDGRLDAFVTNRFSFGNFLYRGLGNAAFEKINAGAVLSDRASSNSSHWVDLENDGDLDLFVVNFQARHFLYLNGGAPAYSLAKVDTSAMLANSGNSIVGVWADFDNDRDQDLFVGNGSNENNELWVNHGHGEFRKITLDDSRSTLGASWGDYDNDGNLDLFVANFLNQHNILYRNSGPPDYTLNRISASIVSNDGGNSVGTVWADFDNDGDLDLFVANDIISGSGGRNFLYLNSGPPLYEFSKVTSGGIVNDLSNSFGSVAGDYDRDGDLDLFVANRLNQADLLYRNDLNNDNHWLIVRCVGTVSNHTAIGARVKVKAGIGGTPRWQMREVASQSGYNCQNLELHFGLGEATAIDSLQVEWPSGITNFFTSIETNQFITIRENGTITGVQAQLETPRVFQLEQNYPNPFNPATKIHFTLPFAQHVALKIYDVTGREVSTLIEAVMAAGSHEINFHAGALAASGLYFYRLSAGNFSETRKMILAR